MLKLNVLPFAVFPTLKTHVETVARGIRMYFKMSEEGFNEKLGTLANIQLANKKDFLDIFQHSISV